MITKCNYCGADVDSTETTEIIASLIDNTVYEMKRECPNDELAKEVISAMESLRRQVSFGVDEVALSLRQLQMIQRTLREAKYGTKPAANPFVEGLDS